MFILSFISSISLIDCSNICHKIFTLKSSLKSYSHKSTNFLQISSHTFRLSKNLSS
ncbi:MAG: hypothetical protein Q8S84_04305 [bacterium]|nr:hypothetical protein [bacterium]MDP3380727.1 hypothetical protein [bacterium]